MRGLLNHVLGGAVMYAAANDGTTTGEDQGDLVRDDPVGALARIAAASLASWREPGALDGDRTYPWGTFPATAGIISNLGEVALHTWDAGEALGQPAQIDPGVARLVYDFYRQVPMEHLRANGVYGPEIQVPVAAPLQDRLLALLGRQRRCPPSTRPGPVARSYVRPRPKFSSCQAVL